MEADGTPNAGKRFETDGLMTKPVWMTIKTDSRTMKSMVWAIRKRAAELLQEMDGDTKAAYAHTPFGDEAPTIFSEADTVLYRVKCEPSNIVFLSMQRAFAEDEPKADNLGTSNDCKGKILLRSVRCL
ncbi:hypothetical protein AAF712_009337 [Marasmius tenuissimus]|uniref:Uncharacterized protein n=1 Tax=Marasmius tenuissimus TaxID=585030 RepID=A0ABR2ZQ31_9AGAR